MRLCKYGKSALFFFLRARANLKCYINKLTSVFHASPVIDHEFRHNIVKVTVDSQTTLTML